MQRTVEQQQSQVLELQQQLAQLRSSHEQLLQQQRKAARLALLRGGRFLLHCADGSTQQVLLYLSNSMPAASGNSNSSSACSSRSNSITAGQQQQQQWLVQQQQPPGIAGSSGCVVLAALPSSADLQQATRRGSLAGAASAAVSWLHLRSDAEPAAAVDGTPAAGTSTGAAPARCLGRQQRKQLAQAALESSELQLEALPRLQVVPLSSYLGVHAGMQHYLNHQQQQEGLAKNAATGSISSGDATAAGTAASSLQDECLSVQFKAADGTVQALTLQVLAVGSGRSRDEWMFALQQLALFNQG
jgi:hypothetical protein